MQLPLQLLHTLRDTKDFDKEAFEKVHHSEAQITSIRLNPAKSYKLLTTNYARHPADKYSPVPWTEYGYYLASRPSFTFDPLFHAGTYYVQEASSMFLEQALTQNVDLSTPLKILDLCAAPGGKSTHIQSLISKDSLLVSNDVIRSRANVLKDNIIKWGCGNVVVTNNDPKDFAKLENYFDIIVVDAPCSGSGLFRRDPEAINEWSENNVRLCSQRQQRILADAWPALKDNGILIYATCSFSKEEDEEICGWIMKNFPAVTIPISVKSEWGITESGGGYRFWPDKVKGEGFFLACFQKKESGEENRVRIMKQPEPMSKKETGVVEKWINKEGLQFTRHLNTIYAWPQQHISDFTFLLHELRVVYSGTRIGELMRDKLVPDHALAMSNIISGKINTTETNYEQAIQYLQRKNLQFQTVEKGWQLVTYGGKNLGWVNVLSNRINNYYPKELRILKDN